MQHIPIQPGRPRQNGCIESSKGKFRDECLSEHCFEALPRAHSAFAIWLREYYEEPSSPTFTSVVRRGRGRSQQFLTYQDSASSRPCLRV
ncbi:hypothetical protein DBR47_14835 [Paucibacter sp. KBW04]|uniref:integrase core domain-containing protein n=1 Tax=Paucibacter sp. KBW04 TaxID=2153361 RepID=UPI000F5669FE|nr:hypothetical protein DBR47_14835 [Paucibacter sp. KBW04]